ncbi:hypothetical protein D9615_008036 [Tricholomella constricta]|uniref:Uncharacterized protein n=1 Tax=Tricholomella constricta TaxID=117010 RepID=A0A8H5LWK9_9AGAR|nr:hypothetical protein D9615_008036 [Tricholomella constricta]
MSNFDPSRPYSSSYAESYAESSASSSTQPSSASPQSALPTQAHNQSYYNTFSSWQANWTPTVGYPYSTASRPYAQTAFLPYQPPSSYTPQNNPHFTTTQTPKAKPRSPTPPRPTLSPSPPLPETYRHWDQVIYAFLTRLGLTQAASGFEADMLVMNPTWEQNNVPDALTELAKHIQLLGKGTAGDNNQMNAETKERPLEQRKLDYVHLANNVPSRSQSTINKEISVFLARNRARNDVSNRAEFLYTLAQKRQRLGETDAEASTSCARTDAKPLDRDVQMKYDIAKNEEGPLSRTMHVAGAKEEEDRDDKGKGKAKMDREGSLSKVHGESEAGWTTQQHPGINERLWNIETHLAVRYVPSPPRTLLARLKFLEEHLIHLEKEYPPWAALHFNQPNRGWPPPPRQTPIIVPPHLRDVTSKIASMASRDAEEVGEPPGDGRPRNTTSSLHRAVLERLEIKQARSDLAGSRVQG